MASLAQEEEPEITKSEKPRQQSAAGLADLVSQPVSEEKPDSAEQLEVASERQVSQEEFMAVEEAENMVNINEAFNETRIPQEVDLHQGETQLEHAMVVETVEAAVIEPEKEADSLMQGSDKKSDEVVSETFDDVVQDHQEMQVEQAHEDSMIAEEAGHTEEEIE